MVRKFERKTERGVSEDVVQAAVKLVKEGLSIRKAAAQTKMSHVNLSRVNKGEKTGYQKNRMVFSEDQELELSEYTLTCTRMNHGMTTFDLRNLAYRFAKANNIAYPKVKNCYYYL